MNVDSREQRNDFSLGWVKRQLRALAAAQPPSRLAERLLADVPGRTAGQASPWHVRRWPRATGWAGIAAAMVVFCGVLWLHTPTGPSARLSPDVNNGSGRVLAADYNGVRPADINALDSNGLN
jgi:hypothetical protein